MRIDGRLLRDMLSRRADFEKPSAREIYAAATLIGLDADDIRLLCKRSVSSKLELLVTKYWYVLFAIGILIDAIIILLLSRLPPGWPSDRYPRGPPGGPAPTYGVPLYRVETRHSKKGISAS